MVLENISITCPVYALGNASGRFLAKAVNALYDYTINCLPPKHMQNSFQLWIWHFIWHFHGQCFAVHILQKANFKLQMINGREARLMNFIIKMWPFTRKRTLKLFPFWTVFRFQTIRKAFEINPFERLVPTIPKNLHLFKRLGQPFAKIVNPFERFGKPLNFSICLNGLGNRSLNFSIRSNGFVNRLLNFSGCSHGLINRSQNFSINWNGLVNRWIKKSIAVRTAQSTVR